MDLLTLRERTDLLTTSLGRARAEAEAGQVAAPDLAGPLRAHAELLSSEAFALVREARARAVEKNEARRVRRLEALTLHLWRLQALASSAPAQVKAATIAAGAEIVGVEPGERFTLAEAVRALSTTGGRDARASLAARVDLVRADLDPQGARVVEAWHGAAARAGFSGPAAILKSCAGFELSEVGSQCEKFLAGTAAMYADVLAWWLRKTLETKPFPHGAESHDLARVFGPPAHEGVFPRADVATLLRRLPAMELSAPRVKVSVESHPWRAARACVVAPEVPSDVRVIARPGRGVADAWAFLRASGTAIHLAHVEGERPFEDRLAGDAAVPLATGELFGTWVTDALWLKRVLDVEGPDVVRVFALWRLSEVRRLAAHARHAIELLTEGPRAGSGERFAELVSDATLARTSPHGFAAMDPVTVLDELRATMLAAALHETVRDRFDEDWWLNPRTGGYLRKLFETGGFETAQAVSERLCGGPLSMAAVARGLEARLA